MAGRIEDYQWRSAPASGADSPVAARQYPGDTLILGTESFERLLALRNDVGLLSEEYDPRYGRLAGTMPQAFGYETPDC